VQFGSRDLFLHAQLWTCHGTSLTEINDAVDDGPVFVAPWTVDASAAIH